MSTFIIPLVVLLIIIYGIIKKRDVYSDFIEGVKDSFGMILTLFPTYVAMILGINLIVNSGLLNLVFKLISYLIKLPSEVLTLAFIRPVSGSASLALLNTIFDVYGPDSFIGLISSVMQGSTDTTLYIITLYFGSVGIRKIRHSLWVGLIADLIGIISSILISNLLFN